MVPVDILWGLQCLGEASLGLYTLPPPTYILNDADKADVSPRHGVVLVRPQDVRPRHYDSQVVVVRHRTGRCRYLQIEYVKIVLT